VLKDRNDGLSGQLERESVEKPFHGTSVHDKKRVVRGDPETEPPRDVIATGTAIRLKNLVIVFTF
jgi:hypothetical protein